MLYVGPWLEYRLAQCLQEQQSNIRGSNAGRENNSQQPRFRSSSELRRPNASLVKNQETRDHRRRPHPVASSRTDARRRRYDSPRTHKEQPKYREHHNHRTTDTSRSAVSSNRNQINHPTYSDSSSRYSNASLSRTRKRHTHYRHGGGCSSHVNPSLRRYQKELLSSTRPSEDDVTTTKHRCNVASSSRTIRSERRIHASRIANCKTVRRNHPGGESAAQRMRRVERMKEIYRRGRELAKEKRLRPTRPYNSISRETRPSPSAASAARTLLPPPPPRGHITHEGPKHSLSTPIQTEAAASCRGVDAEGEAEGEGNDQDEAEQHLDDLMAWVANLDLADTDA